MSLRPVTPLLDGARRAGLVACAVALLAACATADPGPPTRRFPQTALRGNLQVVQAPQVTMNGQAARLAPGARIRDADNRMLLTGQVESGRTYVVHYTIEGGTDLIRDVWLLSREEVDRTPWPTNRRDAERWQFDDAAQTWSRR